MDILLVEDDELVRRCLAETLAEAGFTTHEIASAEAAMEWLEHDAPPTLIVTDVNLGGGMDGLSFGRAARLLWPDLPVIYISGRYPDVLGLAADERFLSKPFASAALLRAIADVRAPAG